MEIKEYINSENSIDKNTMYFDIETLGFHKQFHEIILITATFMENDSMITRQYYAQTPKEENQILKAFVVDLKKQNKIITYNGKNFDIPFLKERMSKSQIIIDWNNFEHIDLMLYIKPLKEFWGLDNLKLKSVEAFFGFFRKDQISGKDSVIMYKSLQKEYNQTFKNNILLHNLEDVEYLIKIYHAIDNKIRSGLQNLKISNHLLSLHYYGHQLSKNSLKVKFMYLEDDFSLDYYFEEGEKIIALKNIIELEIFFKTGFDKNSNTIRYYQKSDWSIPFQVNEQTIIDAFYQILAILFNQINIE